MNKLRTIAPCVLTLLAFAAVAHAQTGLGGGGAGDAPDSTKIQSFIQWALTLTLLVVDACVFAGFLVCLAKLVWSERKGHAAMGLIVCAVAATLLTIGLLYMKSQLSTVDLTV